MKALLLSFATLVATGFFTGCATQQKCPDGRPINYQPELFRQSFEDTYKSVSETVGANISILGQALASGESQESIQEKSKFETLTNESHQILTALKFAYIGYSTDPCAPGAFDKYNGLVEKSMSLKGELELARIKIGGDGKNFGAIMDQLLLKVGEDGSAATSTLKVDLALQIQNLNRLKEGIQAELTNKDRGLLNQSPTPFDTNAWMAIRTKYPKTTEKLKADVIADINVFYDGLNSINESLRNRTTSMTGTSRAMGGWREEVDRWDKAINERIDQLLAMNILSKVK